MRGFIFLSIFILCGFGLVWARPASNNASPDDPVIDVSQLQELLKEGKTKVLDATYTIKKAIDWKTFRKDFYGNFAKSSQKFAEKEYEKEHIHGAVLFNLEVGLFTGEFKRLDLYPTELFEKYVRGLGINNGDHIVVYGRGAFSGMLFPAHVWWVLKYYGATKVQVLNGGIEAWKKAGNPVDSEKVLTKKGDFTAKINPNYAITFEELATKETNGSAILDMVDAFNLLDGRPFEEYTGEKPHQYASSGPMKGFHIKGAKSLPAKELVDENGLKSPLELKLLLAKAGYVPGIPSITYCSAGNQASLLFLALTSIGAPDVRMYQGGMAEMALRDPQRIV